MKKLLLAAAIIFCAAGFAQAVVIDDFTQDRLFRIETSTTDFRTDVTKTHIIGGRCDITFNIYAGVGSTSLVFFTGSEAQKALVIQVVMTHPIMSVFLIHVLFRLIQLMFLQLKFFQQWRLDIRIWQEYRP